ncbi:MAG: menaquinone biosynthesis protein [Planctomycetia bacterium]|nr:menaquinone biosynthesis protein [Planctomycetia bacterium]
MSDQPAFESMPVEKPVYEPVHFRIGGVRYLNAVPLEWRLEEIAAGQNATVSVEKDVPSVLARKLVAGEYDAAIIPVVEAMRHPELVQVSDACIASEGVVASIRLLCLKPVTEVETVGLDENSRSSAAMVGVCLRERFKRNPQEVPFCWEEMDKPDFYREAGCRKLAEALRAKGLDAVLMIGDDALVLPRTMPGFASVMDMGQCWTQWIGLPFVYASWFARPGADGERLSRIFNECRRAGQVEMDLLCIHEAMKRRLPIDMCHDYLTRKLRYRLGGRERRGVEVFCKMTQKYGLVPLGSDIIFEANRRKFAE